MPRTVQSLHAICRAQTQTRQHGANEPALESISQVARQPAQDSLALPAVAAAKQVVVVEVVIQQVYVLPLLEACSSHTAALAPALPVQREVYQARVPRPAPAPLRSWAMLLLCACARPAAHGYRRLATACSHHATEPMQARLTRPAQRAPPAARRSMGGHRSTQSSHSTPEARGQNMVAAQRDLRASEREARTRVLGQHAAVALPELAAEAGAPAHAELGLVVPWRMRATSLQRRGRSQRGLVLPCAGMPASDMLSAWPRMVPGSCHATSAAVTSQCQATSPCCSA